MIGMLLVDDSPLFCAQFRGLARWEDYGLTVLGEARNGQDAIARIGENQPDIILTDISMPVMDGIGLIEYVRAHYPHIPVIALSAYDDFDYVRSSLRSGACDYILKHKLDVDKLVELVRDAVQAGAEGPADAGAQAYGRREFFALVLGGWPADPAMLRRRMEELGLEFPPEGCIPAVVGLEPRDDRGEAGFTEPLTQLLLECLNHRVWEYLRLRDDLLLLLLPTSWRTQPGSSLPDAMRAAAVTVGRFFGAELSCCIGENCDGMSRLSGIVSELRERHFAMRFLGRRGFLVDGGDPGEAAGQLSREDEGALVEALERGDRESATERLRAILAGLRDRGASPMDISMLYTALVNALVRVCGDGAPPDAAWKIPDVHDFGGIGEMRAWLEARCGELADRQRERLSRRYNDYVRQIMQYVHRHYAERISLREIAASVGLSESYVSRLFKGETGVNIVTYINGVRMDEAERLLRQTSLPIKVIARRVGIENYNRFFSIFREHKGCTPRDVRDRA